ncbi:MAG: hypothetical protein A2176_03335 [Spirochaetes bacterium RBG_13_51_14]|nr:MAG: hypothetical protein A2176_03335 [Spirochaetes bacterium RBG_13_51_14]
MYYVWSNVHLTPQQFAEYSRIWPVAYTASIIMVLAWNRILLKPVLAYFKKLLNNEPVKDDDYNRAKKRFFRLPLLHAIGAFARWIIGMSFAIVPFTLFVAHRPYQVANLWMGAGICAIFGMGTYFPITEIYAQRLLDRGIFAVKTGAEKPLRFNLLQRFTLISVFSVLIAVAEIFTLFHSTVESHNIGSPLLYANLFVWIGCSIVFSILLPLLANHKILNRITSVIDFLKEIGRGNLDIKSNGNIIRDEVAEINDAIYDMKEKLKQARKDLMDLNVSLEQKVKDRTAELRRANDNLAKLNRVLMSKDSIHRLELQMAASVQDRYLSRELPHSPDYDIAYVFRPKASVSGDFYDFISVDGRLAGIGLFDVSGHGIASGLITLLARSVIERTFRAHPREKIGTIMGLINRELINEIGDLDNYLTGVLLRFTDDRIEYANSAHGNIFYRSAASDRVRPVRARGDTVIQGHFLGVKNLDEEYRTITFRIRPGDSLFLFTDGMSVSMNEFHDYYRQEQIIDAIRQAPHGTAREALDFMLDDFYSFIGDPERAEDDITAIVVRKL